MSKQNNLTTTYSESRNIAFGDYESRTVFISLGCDLKPKGVDIKEQATEEVGESFEKAIANAMAKVQYQLDKREAQIRKLVLDNGYSITGDTESYEKKLINANDRVKSYKVKQEMKKVK